MSVPTRVICLIFHDNGAGGGGLVYSEVFIRVDLNDECFSVLLLVFSWNIFGKSRKTSPPKKVALQLLGFFRKFRYKAVEDRAIRPLELYPHSRAHRADRRRS